MSSFLKNFDECDLRKAKKWLTDISILCCWLFSKTESVVKLLVSVVKHY